MNAASGSGADLPGLPTTTQHRRADDYYHYSPPGAGGLYHQTTTPPVGGGSQYHLEKSQYHLEKYQQLQQYSVSECYSSHGLPSPAPQCDYQLKDHHSSPHHHHRVLQGATVAVPAVRQCRLGVFRRRLTSMGYGIMLCTFLWVFLYTLTFSCCVGNSRLEVVASSRDENGGAQEGLVAAGSTRHLQHDLRHRRRDAPLLQGGRGAGGGEDEGIRKSVGYSFLQGKGSVVPGRRLEEDEDDTIYTLPDDEREEGVQSPKHRSTYGDQGHGEANPALEDADLEERRNHERYVLNRATDDQHDDQGGDEGDEDYRPGHPPRTHPRHDGDSRGNAGSRHSNRRDSNKPPTGDSNNINIGSKTNSINNPPSDSSNNDSNHQNKNRIKYDNGKPPRRRGGHHGGRGGSRSRRLDPSDWTKEGYSRKLPHALIIGVKKGGTRALLEFLRVHPDIRAPGPEPHFFDRNYDKGLEWYRSQMPPTLDSQLTLEKTPSYFVTKGVPGKIFNMSRNIKLIVVVRDPVTRAISDYTQSSSKRSDVKAFENMAFLDNSTGLVDTSWGAIRIGVYAKHLERWLRYFPLTQIHFVSGERLISDPAAELAKVQDFLGLKRVITDKHFYFNSTKGFPCLKKPEGSGNPHCLGKTKGRPHPKVDPKVIKRLHDFYRPFNAKFYQMTNIDFGWP